MKTWLYKCVQLVYCVYTIQCTTFVTSAKKADFLGKKFLNKFKNLQQKKGCRKGRI